MVEGARELSVASKPPGKPQIIENSLTVIIVVKSLSHVWL